MAAYRREDRHGQASRSRNSTVTARLRSVPEATVDEGGRGLIDIDDITTTIHDIAARGVGDAAGQVSRRDFHAALEAIAALDIEMKRQSGIIDTLRQALDVNAYRKH